MKMTQVSKSSNKTYELNYDIWFGKTSLNVNGKHALKVKKMVFEYKDENQPKTVTVKGNVFGGFKLIDGNEEIILTRPLLWYEWILVIAPFGLLVGGALGGALGAIAAIGNTIVCRQTKNPIIKIFVSLLFTGLAAMIYLLVAGLVTEALSA